MHKKLFKKNPAKSLKSAIPKMDGVCDLTEMKIGDDGLKELIGTIIDNQKLFHTLELIGNNITDTGVDYVTEIIRSCPKFHTIKLEFNHLSAFGAEKLANALKQNTTVRNLNLYNNKISDEGVEHFAKLLANNSTLQYLGLFGCDIHDKGANALAEVLYFGHNQTLRKVVLSNNPIEDDDIMEAIEVALKRNLGEKITDDDFPVLFIERLNKKHARTSRRMISTTVYSPTPPDSVLSLINAPNGGGAQTDDYDERPASNRFSSSLSPVQTNRNSSSSPSASLVDPSVVSSPSEMSDTGPQEDISENPVKRMMEKSGFKTSTIAPPQANPIVQTRRLLNKADSKRVFGMPLEVILRREEEPGPYPVVVENILSYLERNCLKVEGLLRVPGQTKDMEQLRKDIDKGQEIDFDELNLNGTGKPHTVCGLIKSFTRELPEPLLTYDYFDQFISAVKKTSSDEQVRELQKLISMVPATYKACLSRIIQFFLKVIASPETKMSPATISTCFGMNLMRMRPEEEDAQKLVQNTKFINKVCELLIVHAKTLFPDTVSLNKSQTESDKKRMAALQFENGALKRKVEQLQQEKASMEEEWQTEVAALKEEIARLKQQQQ